MTNHSLLFPVLLIFFSTAVCFGQAVSSALPVHEKKLATKTSNPALKNDIALYQNDQSSGQSPAGNAGQSGPSASTTPVADEVPLIQDNSFLIEEAYNQDAGIVQNILTFTRARNGDWLSTYTQEIPIWTLKHQFSYTIPIQHFADASTGIGDIAINYRYQAFGNSEAKYLFAPRFSVLIPTGNRKKDLGLGAVGYQFNLPLTAVHHEKVTTHWNAGLTYTPNARNASGDKADSFGYNFGQSTIWTPTRRFNVLFETLWNTTQSVASPGRVDNEDSLIINPGVRWSHNFKNGTQIVPGISIPIGIGPSKGDVGVFLYLSIEHNWPFFGRSKD